jgi:hypothetical protein
MIMACTAALMLAACASTPPAAKSGTATVAEKPAVPGQHRAKWTKATEAEVAKSLDQKFQEAAKYFVKLKRDDEVMYCKRYRDIGSMIPQLHCITEAELRKQVEDSDEMRDQMRRRVGKCSLGPGCSGGPDPVSKFPLPQQ